LKWEVNASQKIRLFLHCATLDLRLMYSVRASLTTVSFYGDGVTVDLTYPEEAYPSEIIVHKVTITSITELTLRNFTVVIKAPVNSGW
jgi:hypothetical protein